MYICIFIYTYRSSGADVLPGLGGVFISVLTRRVAKSITLIKIRAHPGETGGVREREQVGWGGLNRGGGTDL